MDMTGFARRIGIGLLAGVLWCGIAVGQGWQHLGKVQRVEKLKDGVELTSGAAKVRITVFRDGIFRIRVAPDGRFPKDFSWAVIESPEPPAVKIEENQKEIQILSGNVIATVQKSPLLITFFDAAGTVDLADEPDLPMACNGKRIHIWKKMPRIMEGQGGTVSGAPTLDARLPAMPLFVLSGIARAGDRQNSSREENTCGHHLSRYRLSAGLCALHDQPGILSHVRENDFGFSRSGNAHDFDHRPAHQERSEPWLRALRLRDEERYVCEESRRLSLRRCRLTLRTRDSRFYFDSRAGMVGLALL